MVISLRHGGSLLVQVISGQIYASLVVLTASFGELFHGHSSVLPVRFSEPVFDPLDCRNEAGVEGKHPRNKVDQAACEIDMIW